MVELNFLDIIDQKILNLCTKFSHSFQRLTGLTNYFIAKIGCILAAVSIILSIINYYHKFLVWNSSFLGVIFDLICLFSVFFKSLISQKAEDSFWNSIKPSILKYYELPAFCRLFFVEMFLFDIIGDLFLFFMKHISLVLSFEQFGMFLFGLTIFYYFIVVTPLPPGMGKLKSFLSKFIFTSQLAHEKS